MTPHPQCGRGVHHERSRCAGVLLLQLFAGLGSSLDARVLDLHGQSLSFVVVESRRSGARFAARDRRERALLLLLFLGLGSGLDAGVLDLHGEVLSLVG
jgi:hypothetical protein